MYQIKAEMDASGIYLDEELDRFCAVYFKPKRRQSPSDHLQKISEGSISLSDGQARRLDGPAEVRSGLPQPDSNDPAFEPIVLEDLEDGALRIIAELVEVL